MGLSPSWSGAALTAPQSDRILHEKAAEIVIATILAHHWFGGVQWSDMLSGTGPEAAWIVVLLLVGACGKSAQGPFTGWLARAMEGPTPSSAVFYGAISVHAGAYLLLRVQPLIGASEVATALVIGIGLATALVATVAQRTRPDSKTSLAYAAQTQVGLIFVEIGLGWTGLALLHIVGHAMLGTMQFLRAPSLLHDHHKLHAAAGGRLRPADPLFAMLPMGARYWLYRFSMAAGHSKTPLKTPQDVISVRAAERWGHLIERKPDLAWPYLTPGYRETHDAADYERNMRNRPVMWKKADFQEITCDEEVVSCAVDVKITFRIRSSLPGVGEIESSASVTERWLNLRCGDVVHAAG